MNNETTLERPSLTPEVVRSKMQIALSKAEQSIQALHDAESELVYNEDNLEAIALFLKNAKAAKKLVDDERVRLKQPSLQEGRAIDAGAKLVDVELDAVIAKANLPYQKLCQEVERKRQEAEAEKQRVAIIEEKMNNSKIDFSVRISNAKTSLELVAIERLLNLETANKVKYQEYLPKFKSLCEPIRSLLAAQKEKVRELEELERKSQEAAKNGSDEEILQIMEEKELLEAEISEKKILVQEEASNQAQQSTATAEIIIPIIPKGGRRQWKYEVVDIKAAQKAGLTKMVIDEEKIEARLKEIKETETECIENGVKYYIFKKW